MAAVLTGLMILLFLGNWRLTLIILVSIPLSVLTAVIVMYVLGETFNVMTLGGFALAVGILVDNATVVIENVERHLSLGNDLEEAIVQGAGEVGFPTMVSTLSICIVFVPIFLLQGTAKYLFSPLAVAVIASLLASLLISFTLVPLLFKLLMKRYAKARLARPTDRPTPTCRRTMRSTGISRNSASAYRHFVAWGAHRPVVCGLMFVIAAGVSWLLFPILGMDFFPQVDAGQMRLHVRAPNGTRLEKTQELFGHVEAAIREIVGRDEVDVMLDNIGLPYSGINIALSDTATAGPMDGEILISLVKNHRAHGRAHRRPAARAAGALSRNAVLLPAGGHRQPGPQLRPAFAD